MSLRRPQATQAARPSLPKHQVHHHARKHACQQGWTVGPAIESVETSTEQKARWPKGDVSNQVRQTVKSARAKCENEPTAQVRLPA